MGHVESPAFMKKISASSGFSGRTWLAIAGAWSCLASDGLRAAPDLLAGPWSGAVTPHSAAVCAPLNGPGISARLAVSTDPGLANPMFTTPVISAAVSGNNVRLDVAWLSPDTVYFYALELDGVLLSDPGKTGTFRTFPNPGPASFRFAFSACCDIDESAFPAFDAIRGEGARFFIHMGDFTYDDTNSSNPAAYRADTLGALQVDEIGEMFRSLPVFYMWDDHDFSGDFSNRYSTGSTAHRQVYREMVPHYPLPAGGPDAAIYQTFDYGRVRFILSDLRSEREDDDDDDDAAKTMMGAVQKQWFKNQLVAARDGEVPLIVWVSSVPFIATSTASDNWGSYQTERQELLEFVRDERIQNLIVISGDMHALAYDDGRATEDYVAGVRIPVFHAAALRRQGSIKGGPYSGGTSSGDDRYGTLDIDDDGTSLAVTYKGRIAGSSSVTTWKTFTHAADPVRPRLPKNPTARAMLDFIRVSWSDDSGVESGYRIDRRPSGTGVWLPLVTVAAGTTGHDDASAVLPTAYDYRIVALNGSVESEPSAMVTATPDDSYRNWKLENLGSINAPDGDDDDGDGLTTLEEFLFGLDPEIVDRYLWTVNPATPWNGQVTVAFPTLAGRSYQVQFSGDLATWNDASAAIQGDGSSKQWIDDGTTTGGIPAAGGGRFFRIVVSPAP